MDRFKFRIWDKESQKYHNGMEVFDYIRGVLSPDKYVMEQSTGLKDKNGKLIYDGDILGGIYGGYIAWCDTEKSFEMFVPEYGCMSCGGDILWAEIVEDESNLEVIGNIHENTDW